MRFFHVVAVAASITAGSLIWSAGWPALAHARRPTHRSVATQSAEEVLDRFVEVTGDPDAYTRLGGLELVGAYTGSHLRFYGVDELPFRSELTADGRWKRTWPSSDITETLVAAEGWRFYPGRGVVPIAALEHAMLLRELPVARATWRQHWDSVALLPDANTGEGPALVVALTHDASGLTVHRAFARDSGLLLESRSAGGEILIRYGDYREVSDVRIPFSVIVDQGPDAHHEYAVREARGGVEIPESAFAKPGS